jgi:hypothetical protein
MIIIVSLMLQKLILMSQMLIFDVTDVDFKCCEA